jgi:2-polyprenyl-3-methyl-5-hydroxy-6-metoxy-1,4-benzoquinol methylase
MPVPPIRWEAVPCPLCGAAAGREFLRAAGDGGHEYKLDRCDRCGLVYLNPRPDEASIAPFYPPDYAPYQPPARRRGRLRRQLRGRLGLRTEKSLSDRIPFRPGGVLLDYGCGSGWFAAQMRDRGWDAFGMDVSPHSVAATRWHFGLRAIQGTLPHPEVPPGALDAVTLRAVLEHVHHPQRLVRAVFEALRPGGWLFVSVPNLSGWGFRHFGRAWSQLDLPRHLSHFTPHTLRRLVEGAGFVVEAVDTPGHTKWMRVSVDRARRESPRWWLAACRARLVCSALTRWTAWAGRGDELALLARKPLVAEVKAA